MPEQPTSLRLGSTSRFSSVATVAPRLLLRHGMKPHWRVLIVDDHAASRAAVAEAVTAQGGQVVGNGSRAEDVLRLVGKHRPDVVVLAGGPPRGGGGQVGPGGDMAGAACRVVRVIGQTDAPVVARAVDAGVPGFLAKPVRAEELGPALDVAIPRFRDIETMRRENETLRRKLES